MPESSPFPDPLALLGGRADQNALGVGRRLAVFVGEKPHLSYATCTLGPLLSLLEGKVADWNGAGVRLRPVQAAEGVWETRRITVDANDVLLVEIEVENRSDQSLQHELRWSGDASGAREWRESPSSLAALHCREERLELRDLGLYPELLPNGLHGALGSATPGLELSLASAQRYHARLRLRLAAGDRERVRIALALHADPQQAHDHLDAAFAESGAPRLAEAAWRDRLTAELPRFACSEASWNELWAMRVWLLRFSTVAGPLGNFSSDVVLEGREAYPTYCCYSTPFHAFDLSWARDRRRSPATMRPLIEAAFEDGRLPWYVSPSKRDVPVHHASGTGLSLLPLALARHVEIHGHAEELEDLREPLRRLSRWWERERTREGRVRIEHPYESGMDDLRRFADPLAHFDAIDATSYAALNDRALEALANAWGDSELAEECAARASASEHALCEGFWDPEQRRFCDRDGDRSSRLFSVTAFYPFWTDAPKAEQYALLDQLERTELFGTPFGLPAIARSSEGFDPRSYWMGPSWPAANVHVLEALAHGAKRHERKRLSSAGALLRRCVALHLQPRADFYERYDCLSGEALSDFKHYMHSWWIDLFVRHVVGVTPQAQGAWTVDPLPCGLDWFAARDLPYRGRRLSLSWSDPRTASAAGLPPGLSIGLDDVCVRELPAFRPGDDPVSFDPAARGG